MRQVTRNNLIDWTIIGLIAGTLWLVVSKAHGATVLVGTAASPDSADRECPMVVDIWNNTDLPWTAADDAMLNSLTGGCAKRYPESPCLTAIFKQSEQGYGIICSARRVRGGP